MEQIKYPDTIMLIQNSLTTVLLDAIQFYPQESVSQESESHGLLFGNVRNGILECDYIFPVGNVSIRKKDCVKNNPKIDEAIQNAKHLLFTSRYCGTYHSHPYVLKFDGWASPSNADVLYAKYLKTPYMLIIAISRAALFEKTLSIKYLNSSRKKYHHEKKREAHDFPREEIVEGKTIYLQGKFKKYIFELRGYMYDEKCLKEVNLISSEAEMLMELINNKMTIEDLSPEATYALRKIEYDFRVLNTPNDNNNQKARQNMQHHVQTIINNNDSIYTQ